MIVWRNSHKEITGEDFERIARQCAKENGLIYEHYDKFLVINHVLLIIFCKGGRQVRTEVLCEYIQPEGRTPS